MKFLMLDSEEIGVMLPSTFDDNEFEDLTIEEIADGPPEYGEWNKRNFHMRSKNG